MFGIKNWIFAMESQDLPCLWQQQENLAVFGINKNWICWTGGQDISCCVCGDKGSCFKLKYDLSLTLTKSVVSLFFLPQSNQSISTVLSQHQIENVTFATT